MKSNGPWKIKLTKEVYKNPWMKVREDQVIQPNGEDGIHGVVEIQPGISIIPVDEDKNLYLIEEFKYALEEYSIEAIGGGIDQEDSLPKQAAQRELKEETGIEAKEIKNLGRYDPITELIDSPQFLFLAKDLKFGKQNLEVSEEIEVKKIHLDKAIEMVMNSEITEGKTCSLILKIDKYLKNEQK